MTSARPDRGRQWQAILDTRRAWSVAGGSRNEAAPGDAGILFWMCVTFVCVSMCVCVCLRVRVGNGHHVRLGFILSEGVCFPCVQEESALLQAGAQGLSSLPGLDSRSSHACRQSMRLFAAWQGLRWRARCCRALCKTDACKAFEAGFQGRSTESLKVFFPCSAGTFLAQTTQGGSREHPVLRSSPKLCKAPFSTWSCSQSHPS